MIISMRMWSMRWRMAKFPCLTPSWSTLMSTTPHGRKYSQLTHPCLFPQTSRSRIFPKNHQRLISLLQTAVLSQNTFLCPQASNPLTLWLRIQNTSHHPSLRQRYQRTPRLQPQISPMLSSPLKQVTQSQWLCPKTKSPVLMSQRTSKQRKPLSTACPTVWTLINLWNKRTRKTILPQSAPLSRTLVNLRFRMTQLMKMYRIMTKVMKVISLWKRRMAQWPLNLTKLEKTMTRIPMKSQKAFILSHHLQFFWSYPHPQINLSAPFSMRQYLPTYTISRHRRLQSQRLYTLYCSKADPPSTTKL